MHLGGSVMGSPPAVAEGERIGCDVCGCTADDPAHTLGGSAVWAAGSLATCPACLELAEYIARHLHRCPPSATALNRFAEMKASGFRLEATVARGGSAMAGAGLWLLVRAAVLGALPGRHRL